MNKLIDSVMLENEKMNIILSKTGDSVKLLDTSDIKNVAELYKLVYQELLDAKCEKFLHPLDEQQIEEMITSPGAAIVGYFKDKKLAGALYTKPNEENSKYFVTPSYDGDKGSYIIGGLAVHPQFRGNGIISKLTNVAVNGVKEYAVSDKNSGIAGTGFEISCENFGSLLSLGYAKDANMQPIFNFAGVHYIDNPEMQDKDLTVLGYKSFETPSQQIETIPFVVLDGNQAKSFQKLSDAVETISDQAGLDKTVVDGHTIETFATCADTPFKSVISFDQGYASHFPPTLEK